MQTARWIHRATLLANGNVLVTGGSADGSVAIASCELYDPITGAWSPTGSLATARYYHTATLLQNGKVLVAGGYDNSRPPFVFASAEIYDPATGIWSSTSPLYEARFIHTATLLADGKVLVAGGSGENGQLADAELYDPATGTWTETGMLRTDRDSHTATLIGSVGQRRVLVAGGTGGITGGTISLAEFFDLTTQIWRKTQRLNERRFEHTATLLPDGSVLATGGFDSFYNPLASAERYDPQTGAWTETPMLQEARGYHTASLLPGGKVLVAGGGAAGFGALASTEVYDPQQGIWTEGAEMAEARLFHTAVLLDNGQVLVAGGKKDDAGILASAELFNPHVGSN